MGSRWCHIISGKNVWVEFVSEFLILGVERYPFAVGPLLCDPLEVLPKAPMEKIVYTAVVVG
jgi:hypothetical protein